MKKKIAPLAAVLLALSACGGGSNPDASQLAADLGCPSATVSHKLQQNELPRDGRTKCDGLTVVTFTSTSHRDAYVKFVDSANQAFGQNSKSLTGSDWAIFGPPSKVADAKQKVSG